MRAYRYLPRQYAEYAVKFGIFRLSTTAACGQLESKLNDPLDGAVLCRPSLDLGSTKANDLVKLEQLKRFGIHIEPGSAERVVFDRPKLIQRQPGWILCFSDIADNAYIQTADPTADTVVEIADLFQLAARLSAAHPEVRQVAHAGSQADPRIRIDLVKYAQREFEDLNDDVFADPFVKAERFRPEREVRIFWNSRRPVQPLIIEAPDIRGLVRIVGF